MASVASVNLSPTDVFKREYHFPSIQEPKLENELMITFNEGRKSLYDKTCALFKKNIPEFNSSHEELVLFNKRMELFNKEIESLSHCPAGTDMRSKNEEAGKAYHEFSIVEGNIKEFVGQLAEVEKDFAPDRIPSDPSLSRDKEALSKVMTQRRDNIHELYVAVETLYTDFALVQAQSFRKAGRFNNTTQNKGEPLSGIWHKFSTYTVPAPEGSSSSPSASSWGGLFSYFSPKTPLPPAKIDSGSSSSSNSSTASESSPSSDSSTASGSSPSSNSSTASESSPSSSNSTASGSSPSSSSSTASGSSPSSNNSTASGSSPSSSSSTSSKSSPSSSNSTTSSSNSSTSSKSPLSSSGSKRSRQQSVNEG